jgi:hypothetical protein
VVIADLTGQNANVFYELGVRHVLRGRTILLSQDSSFIPFDLKSYAYHIYNWRTKKGKQDLRQKIAVLLKELEQHPHRPDNPVEDFIQSTAERPVFLRAPRFPSATQQSAADAYLREYSELLRSIEWGEIPIPGGASGYFGLFLETVAANKTCEDVRIFASLRPLEVKDGFSKFNRKELFTGLTRAVREKKISIEYLVFLTDRSVLARPDVRALLSEYSNFAHEVRVAYAETYTGHLVDAERTIALLTDHHWAFTHTWSIHADVTHTRQWIFEEAYKRHDETYKRLRMQSEVVFKSKKRK